MTEGYYYVRDWYKKVHYGSRIAPWIKFDQSFFVDSISLSAQDQIWLLKLYLAAIPLNGRLPIDAKFISSLIGLIRLDLTELLIARLEVNCLISKEDVRGAKRVGAINTESVPFSYSDDFLTFWQAYPRKVGKGEAAKAFDKAGLNGKMPEVLAAIETCKKTSQWKDPQYIPHPATWLNQRRWEDEPEGMMSHAPTELTPEEAELGKDQLDEANRSRPQYRSHR